MRHSISVHIFPLFILIIFTLYSIPYIYIQSALYCRIRIFISSASSIYIDYSFFHQRRRYLPDKFREYFNARGIRINILFLQVFILPSREEGREGRKVCKTFGTRVEWAHAHSKWLVHDSRYWHWPFSTGIRDRFIMRPAELGFEDWHSFKCTMLLRHPASPCWQKNIVEYSREQVGEK